MDHNPYDPKYAVQYLDAALDLLELAADILDRYADINNAGGPNAAMSTQTEINEFLDRMRPHILGSDAPE